ncbi:MAG: hypothetical protein ACFFBP_05995 [Promethearchaeota archaeon]
MDISIELINHYPWLPSTKDVYSDKLPDNPIQFIQKIFSNYPIEEIRERIFKIFAAAFENKEEILNYKIDDLNVYLYLILNILLSTLNDNAIANRIANLYSKINYNELMIENDSILYEICNDLKLNILYYQEPISYGINITKDLREVLKTKFKIHFTNYLDLAASLRDDYRKLINNPLLGGYVFIQKRNLIRLLQEYVRKKLIPKQKLDKASIEKLKEDLFKIDGFKEIYDKILNDWEQMKGDFEPIEFHWGSEIELSEIAPPCLKHILQKASESQNLIHNERLFLVFLLHALKIPIEKIVDIFSTLPDFDRDKTLYQVNFALNKKYSPHKCETLKSLNLCMAEKYKDELCLKGYFSKKKEEEKQISHPLTYIWVKQYRLSKHKKSDEMNKEKDE